MQHDANANTYSKKNWKIERKKYMRKIIKKRSHSHRHCYMQQNEHFWKSFQQKYKLHFAIALFWKLHNVLSSLRHPWWLCVYLFLCRFPFSFVMHFISFEDATYENCPKTFRCLSKCQTNFQLLEFNLAYGILHVIVYLAILWHPKPVYDQYIIICIR